MPMSKMEEALVFAAKNGNTKCFEELYSLYYEKIYALALSITKNSADAEDILQTTFISAWQNLDKLTNPAAFNTWLQRIAINQSHSLLRRRRSDTSMDDEGENGEILQLESDLLLPEQYAERDDLSYRLQKMINELSSVQRETVMLYYFNDMTIEEIAQIMDCSVGTVKSRLFLARKALKTEIEEQERKSGEKFYGAALIPFSTIFIRQVKNTMISPSKAIDIFHRVSSALSRIPINPPQPAGSYSGAAQSSPARHAASEKAKSSSARHAASETAKSSPARHAASETAKSPSARHAASSAAKTSFPLWAKIISGVLAVGLIATGGVFAWRAFSPNDDPPVVNDTQSPTDAAAPEESYSIGDLITFGKYEQDNDAADGAEPIEWRILENTDSKVFVVSEYALDTLSYDDYDPNDNWGEAGLRSYLNGEFFSTAFTQEEQRYISDSYILTDEGHDREQPDMIVLDKPKMSDPPRRLDTVVVDKLFILNDFEVSKYFASGDDAIVRATDYAIANGLDADEDKRVYWWLRSHTANDDICFVDNAGYVDTESGGNSSDIYALRPAMWIDINALKQKQDAESVVQPVDTRYLNESLNRFLVSFDFRRFHSVDEEGRFTVKFEEQVNEFDRDKLGETNILYDVLMGYGCVNPSIYSDNTSFSNWKSVSSDPCPVEEFNDLGNTIYRAVDAPEADFIAKNIFGCDDEDIERMRNSFPVIQYGACAYSDGVYYAGCGGEYLYPPCGYYYINGEYRGGYYYYTLDYFANKNHTLVEATIGETPPDKRYYVKTKLLPHEGKPWWSLYYYSTTPFEDRENTFEPETDTAEEIEAVDLTYADLPAEYIFTSGVGGWETGLTISDDGTYKGSFFDMELGLRTVYSCDFHGEFGSIEKVNDYLYKAEILSVYPDRDPGTEIIDGTTYQYIEEARGFPFDSQILYIYTPDTPLSAINQALTSWVHHFDSDPADTLGFYLLAVDDNYGFNERRQ